MKNTPWAILLCKFSDDNSEPYIRQRFDELFTNAGNGKFKMVDFFREMSHGRVDLSGSQVFGWYKLSQKRSDYKGDGGHQKERNDLIEWVDKAWSDSGDKRAGFFKTVVVMNVPTDLFGGGNGVVCHDDRNPINGMSGLSPSYLGQEMGHGYGLNHSRIAGSAVDYMDNWDVMSTAGGAFMAAHPDFADRDVQGRPVFLMGPGLNAANMWAMDWLDMSRVWRPQPGETGQRVQLRPLHRTDLPGFLCAQVGQYFIEFRMNELWDVGFDSPVILIHDFVDGHSYLQPNRNGKTGLISGDYLAKGYVADPPANVHESGLKISVLGIDPKARVADLEVSLWESNVQVAGPGIILGGGHSGILNDGGGWIFLNGRVIRVRPRSPLITVLEHVSQIQESQSLKNPVAASMLRQQSFEGIANIVAGEMFQMASFSEPASPMIEESYHDPIRDLSKTPKEI